MCEESSKRELVDDAAAVRYLLQHAPAGQWQRIAQALMVVNAAGGYGQIALMIRDGRIQGHPTATVSIGDTHTY